MTHCPNSFPHRASFFHLTFLLFVLALAAINVNAQKRPDAEDFQKISFKASQPCVVGTPGVVTALVKNGAELSVTADWDCDGIADAYDNCVGMPNREQTDSDGNGMGDVCEAATIVSSGGRVNRRSTVKLESRKDRSIERHSRSVARGRRGRHERAKAKEAKVRNRKATKRKSRT